MSEWTGISDGHWVGERHSELDDSDSDPNEPEPSEAEPEPQPDRRGRATMRVHVGIHPIVASVRSSVTESGRVMLSSFRVKCRTIP